MQRSTVYRARQKNPRFKERWERALDEAADVLEAEAMRRATRGVERPIFYQGMQVGVARHYSDQLLMFLLKAARPQKYRGLPVEPAVETKPAIVELVERLRQEAEDSEAG